MEKINESFLDLVYKKFDLAMYDVERSTEPIKYEHYKNCLTMLQDLSNLIQSHIPTMLEWCSDLISNEKELKFSYLLPNPYDKYRSDYSENYLWHVIEHLAKKWHELNFIEQCNLSDELGYDSDIYKMEKNGGWYGLSDRQIERIDVSNAGDLVCIYTAVQNEIRTVKIILSGRSLPDDTASTSVTAAPILTDEEISKRVNTYCGKELAKLEISYKGITSQVFKYIGKAANAGYIVARGNGLQWIFDCGSYVSLSYFIDSLFPTYNFKRMNENRKIEHATMNIPKGKRPFKKLQELFGVSRLESAAFNFSGTKKDQSWKHELDDLFLE